MLYRLSLLAGIGLTLFDRVAFGGRFSLIGALPDGRYDLRTNFVDVPSSVSSQAIQQAVLAALQLQIQPKTVTKSMPVG